MISDLLDIRNKIWRRFINQVLPNLIKSKVSLVQEEATDIESIDFVECYATRLKDGICTVTIIGAEISMHIQIFISVKAFFFLKGFQQSGLIIEMTI